MKYAKYLARQTIPEWHNHYFKYKKLKKELKVLVRAFDTNPTKFSEAQQEYVDTLYEELENVNQFFETKEKEIIEQYEQLKKFLADSWRKAPSRRSLISFPRLAKLREKKKGRGSTATLFKNSGSLQPTFNAKEERRKSLPQLPSSLSTTITGDINNTPTKEKVSFKIPEETNNNNKSRKQANKSSNISIDNTTDDTIIDNTIEDTTENTTDNNENIIDNSSDDLLSNNDSVRVPLNSPQLVSSSVPSSSISSPSLSRTPSLNKSPSISLSSPSLSATREPIRDSEMPKPYMPHDSDDANQPQRVTLAKRFRFAIKRSLEEVHRGLSMLKDFSSLNSVGFRKIIKKHDKVPGFPTLSYFLEHEVYTSHFHTSEVPANLLKEVETVYANMFTRGNVRQANDKLRVPNTEDSTDWVSFRFGIFVGACLILVCYLLGQSPNIPNNKPYSQYILYAFRFMGIPVLWLWTFAAVMLIWQRVFIFGWNPRKHITPQNLLEIAASFSLLWLLAFVGYYNCVLGNYPFDKIPDPVYPFIPMGLIMLMMFFPFNAFYRSSRWWMFQTMLRIVRTPLLPVKFKDFFYTNQFSSLKNPFSDMGDTAYFYIVAVWREDNTESIARWTSTALIYRPILQAYPAFLRFLQCLRRYRDSKDTRHLTNAGKYSFSVLTVVFSGIRKAFPQSIPILVIYCLIASISTIYSWLWDVMMDWDLGYRNTKTFLRPKLMYRKPVFYYIAIVLDLGLRGVWAVTLGTSTGSVSFSTYPMNTIASVTEIIRRFMWNIFRLENEHLKNCHHTNAIALPTLLEQYRSAGQVKSYHMKDYEEEEEIEGEGDDVMMEEKEMEMLDKATDGIRHRRIGVNVDNGVDDIEND